MLRSSAKILAPAALLQQRSILNWEVWESGKTRTLRTQKHSFTQWNIILEIQNLSVRRIIGSSIDRNMDWLEYLKRYMYCEFKDQHDIQTISHISSPCLPTGTGCRSQLCCRSRDYHLYETLSVKRQPLKKIFLFSCLSVGKSIVNRKEFDNRSSDHLSEGKKNPYQVTSRDDQWSTAS